MGQSCPADLGLVLEVYFKVGSDEVSLRVCHVECAQGPVRREFGEPNTGVTDNYVLGGMHLTKVQELTG